MSQDSDSQQYCFPGLEEPGRASCSSLVQLHHMANYEGPELGLASEGSDSSVRDAPASTRKPRKTSRSRSLHEEDVEMKSSGSSGSSGSGNESHSNESHGNESRGNESHGNESVGSSNETSKDSALLESSESNKSVNSHSPSPPSSSNAFSLLSSEQDNPSTSGCSSQESAKAKNQKEVIKTLKELKLRLPAEKRHNNKSSTVNTLKYALRCVKQVAANEEYYQLLMTNDSQPPGLDVSSYTIEEIDSITTEYTLKNNDIFAVAVSLITGRIVYISDQAASILNCNRDVFRSSKFVEFLMPQDVSVFYSFTTPYRLPSWSMCTGGESSPSDCMQEKSFFCRISGGKGREGDLRYYPFRMTPYLMKVQDSTHAEDQFCCLLLAERVHSGYEAPRIPTDKRIFTTTHTPSCVFQDVDERAVPLLGYLAQDLIGTPLLLHLHPNDRPIMLAIHRKILQFAGQPFDHSSIRFCARNGEYVVLDTSWSSFVNPWSRKVSFVIGRHKVRMGPVNEDIFLVPPSSVSEKKAMDSDIQEITEKIHRLLLQPVRTSGSSGHGSLNGNDHLLGLTSSSERLDVGSEGRTQPEEDVKARPRTFQEICQGVHRQKNQEQQTAKPVSRRTIEPAQRSQTVVRPKDSAAPLNWREAEESRGFLQEELTLNEQTVSSYQQVNCLDSVIRYLESCNVPITIKRKCQSSTNTTSSNSDEDKHKGSNSMETSEEPALLKDPSLGYQDKKSSDAVVGASLPLPVPDKPESVVSITSQCSYSSTIVHVGDKKLQPESEIIEDVPGVGETAESGPPCPEREPYRKLGLTKQVLAAHTQKEEQAFLFRFRELRGLRPLKPNGSQYLEQKKEQILTNAALAAPHPRPAAGPSARRGTRNKKTKSKRAKQVESSDSSVSQHRQQHLRPPLLTHGLNQTSWSLSDTSQSTFPMAYPTVVPGYPLQVYPQTDSSANAYLQGFRDSHGAPSCAPHVIPAAAYPSSMVPPALALVLPNYLYPVMVPGPPPPQPLFQADMAGFPSFTTPPSFNAPTQLNLQHHFPPPPGFLTPSFCFPPPDTPKPAMEGQSRSSTPQSSGAAARTSPPLFQSRCSSPLNLLELELSVDRQESAAIPTGGQTNNSMDGEKGANSGQAKERELKQSSSSGDGNNSDDNSLSSDMLDLLLQEDSCSGTGSATSGSMGSRSNGCGTSASGTSQSRTSASGGSASGGSASGGSASGGSASGTGSKNSSKYFGSVDSSQNSQKVKGHTGDGGGSEAELEQNDHLIKYVLQDPLWLLAANTDEKVMMGYQLISRDLQRVLREDKDKLRLLQKNQPRFSEEQKKELMEVHPWMKRGGLPQAIDIKMCSCCDGSSEAVDQTGLDMGDTETGELGCQSESREEATYAAVVSGLQTLTAGAVDSRRAPL